MRVLVVFVLVVCVGRGALGVWVRVGDQSFPLETVKELKKVMDLDGNVRPELNKSFTKDICANPLLPQVFRTVCQREEAGSVFSNLLEINMNECEVCANPACTGCM